MINTLPEAEIIAGTIDPDKEEATALPHRVVTDLECLDPFSNLLVRLSLTLFKQLQQHQVLVLQENQESSLVKVTVY